MAEQQPDVQLISWGLLGEWWCVKKGIPEETILKEIKNHFALERITPTLLKQRLYGGWRCGDDENRTHIYHATGQYTYLGTNVDVEPEARRKEWNELLNANRGQDGYTMYVGGLFGEDAPV